MTKYLTLFILFLFSYLAAQQPLPVFDGVVTEEEWKEAKSFTINYEISPGNNTPSPHITRAFITYSETDLYVGFIAYADMENLRSSIRNRDEGYQDDNVLIGIDTYGDGRFMVTLGANPEGNQLDLNFHQPDKTTLLITSILSLKPVNMTTAIMSS